MQRRRILAGSSEYSPADQPKRFNPRILILGTNVAIVVLLIATLVSGRAARWEPNSALVFGIEVYLGLLSVFIAVFSWSEASKQTRHLREITASVSTSYIGRFPNHLREVIRLVDQAKGRIRILVDYADYGSFSAPRLHSELTRAIENARQRDPAIVVQMLITSNAEAGDHISRNSPFFKRSYAELCDDASFVGCLTEYASFFSYPMPTDEGGWRALLRRTEMRVAENLSRCGVQIRQDYAPDSFGGLFFWIRDDEEAVFMFTHVGDHSQQIAFRTRDPLLLGACDSAFKRTWDQGTVRGETSR